MMLRRIRAAFRTGLSWAAVWGCVGTLASSYLLGFASAGPARPLRDLAVTGGLAAWYGFLAGITFSLVLALAGRRRFRELTPLGMAGLGAAASVLLTAPPMVYMLAGRTDGWRTEDGVYLTASLLLSAGCAAGSLVLARRARGVPPEMLFSAADALGAGDPHARSASGRRRTKVVAGTRAPMASSPRSVRG